MHVLIHMQLNPRIIWLFSFKVAEKKTFITFKMCYRKFQIQNSPKDNPGFWVSRVFQALKMQEFSIIIIIYDV